MMVHVDCGLSCVNGGMLINTACTCECPGNFDGDMCESKHCYFILRNNWNYYN